ncbi:lactococcin 972 family bacteriocin [Clostridium sporogenes]
MNKKTINKKIASIALLISILGSTTTAFAYQYVGGGQWDHGITYAKVWSNYYHSSAVHGSTAGNKNGKYFSGWKSPGAWSYKKINASVYGNTAYWSKK